MKNYVKNSISLFLIICLSLSVVACSKNEPTADNKKVIDKTEDNVDIDTSESKTESSLDMFLKKEGKNLESKFENKFKDISGQTCDCSIVTDGKSMTIDCKVNISIPDGAKGHIQEMLDNNKKSFEPGFKEIKKGLPSLENIVFNLSDEDGKTFASIKF